MLWLLHTVIPDLQATLRVSRRYADICGSAVSDVRACASEDVSASEAREAPTKTRRHDSILRGCALILAPSG